MRKEPVISSFKQGCSFYSLALRRSLDRQTRLWNLPAPAPPNSTCLPLPHRSRDFSTHAPILLCPPPVTHPCLPEWCWQTFPETSPPGSLEGSTCLCPQSALPPASLTPELVSSTADTRLAHSFGEEGQDFSPAPLATRRVYIRWGGGRGILYFGLVYLF